MPKSDDKKVATLEDGKGPSLLGGKVAIEGGGALVKLVSGHDLVRRPIQRDAGARPEISGEDGVGAGGHRQRVRMVYVESREAHPEGGRHGVALHGVVSEDFGGLIFISDPDGLPR